jgi:hypothetical protein
VHHGAIDAKEARSGAQHQRQYGAKINDEHIEVIQISSDVLGKEDMHKVDVGRKVLVTATAEDGGVSFDFGEAGGSLTAG